MRCLRFLCETSMLERSSGRHSTVDLPFENGHHVDRQRKFVYLLTESSRFQAPHKVLGRPNQSPREQPLRHDIPRTQRR